MGETNPRERNDFWPHPPTSPELSTRSINSGTFAVRSGQRRTPVEIRRRVVRFWSRRLITRLSKPQRDPTSLDLVLAHAHSVRVAR